MGKFFYRFFHVSDHLEQFGGLLFYFIGKINYLLRFGMVYHKTGFEEEKIEKVILS